MNSRTALRGSPERTSASPTSATSAPQPRYPATPFGPVTPDSAPLTVPSGMPVTRSANTVRSTSSVVRSRALMPRSSATAAARRTSSAVRLHERRETQLLAQPHQVGELGIVERHDHEKRKIGAVRASLPQPIGVDDEILAQDGHVDPGTHGVQIGEGAAETPALGEHADRSGAAGRVLGREGRGIGDVRQRNLAGTLPLHLGDDRHPGRTERGQGVKRGYRVRCPGAQLRQRPRTLALFQVIANPREDPIENGRCPLPVESITAGVSTCLGARELNFSCTSNHTWDVTG